MKVNKVYAGNVEFEIPDSEMDEVMKILHSKCTGAAKPGSLKIQTIHGKASGSIAKGKIVYISDAQGDNPVLSLC
jgi:hypothetical protein